MGNKLIKALREVSPRTAARIAISHVVLLIGSIWGGLPYIFLQLLLVAELVLLTLATIPLYPGRSILTHALDMLKLCAGLAFVFFFILVGYGVARGGSQASMIAGLVDLRDIGISDAAWALGYLILSLAISMNSALRSANPRKTWAKSKLADGATTFLALFFMVFVTFFIGKPILSGLASIGLKIDVDVLLSTLMVIVRYILSLVMSTISDSEMETISRNPYLEGGS